MPIYKHIIFQVKLCWYSTCILIFLYLIAYLICSALFFYFISSLLGCSSHCTLLFLISPIQSLYTQKQLITQPTFKNPSQMGNTNDPNTHTLPPGISQFLTQQLNRLTNNSTRTYLTLTQLLQAKHPQDYPFTFKHLGIVYLCDYDHDGVFSRNDLEMFVLWIQINMGSVQMYQFQGQLQAKAVGCLLEAVESKDGENGVISWFMEVLLACHSTHSLESNLYISIDSIKTIYQLFNIQMMTDMDIQQFFYLAKKSSQELGYKIQEIIENDEEEEYIVVFICQEFIRGFFRGVAKILAGIGYQVEIL